MADPEERPAPPARVVLGLGNPGEQYVATRHNVGFRVVDELARRRGITLREGECRARLGRDGGLTLVAPQTFMNRSGFTARCLTELYGFEPTDFLVVYDEIHLPLGTLRLRPKGSPAGHRGMESVIENLGSDQVPRLRLGVGVADGPPVGDDLVSFVLEPFEAAEEELVEAMIRRAADACETWVEEGAASAMQRFNGPVAP